MLHQLCQFGWSLVVLSPKLPMQNLRTWVCCYHMCVCVATSPQVLDNLSTESNLRSLIQQKPKKREEERKRQRMGKKRQCFVMTIMRAKRMRGKRTDRARERNENSLTWYFGWRPCWLICHIVSSIICLINFRHLLILLVGSCHLHTPNLNEYTN